MTKFDGPDALPIFFKKWAKNHRFIGNIVVDKSAIFRQNQRPPALVAQSRFFAEILKIYDISTIFLIFFPNQLSVANIFSGQTDNRFFNDILIEKTKI